VVYTGLYPLRRGGTKEYWCLEILSQQIDQMKSKSYKTLAINLTLTGNQIGVWNAQTVDVDVDANLPDANWKLWRGGTKGKKLVERWKERVWRKETGMANSYGVRWRRTYEIGQTPKGKQDEFWTRSCIFMMMWI